MMALLIVAKLAAGAKGSAIRIGLRLWLPYAGLAFATMSPTIAAVLTEQRAWLSQLQAATR